MTIIISIRTYTRAHSTETIGDCVLDEIDKRFACAGRKEQSSNWFTHTIRTEKPKPLCIFRQGNVSVPSSLLSRARSRLYFSSQCVCVGARLSVSSFASLLSLPSAITTLILSSSQTEESCLVIVRQFISGSCITRCLNFCFEFTESVIIITNKIIILNIIECSGDKWLKIAQLLTFSVGHLSVRVCVRRRQ